MDAEKEAFNQRRMQMWSLRSDSILISSWVRQFRLRSHSLKAQLNRYSSKQQIFRSVGLSGWKQRATGPRVECKQWLGCVYAEYWCIALHSSITYSHNGRYTERIMNTDHGTGRLRCGGRRPCQHPPPNNLSLSRNTTTNKVFYFRIFSFFSFVGKKAKSNLKIKSHCTQFWKAGTLAWWKKDL